MRSAVSRSQLRHSRTARLFESLGEFFQRFLAVTADGAEQLRADGVPGLPGDAPGGPADGQGQRGDRILVLGVLQQP
jgi:hypothetical protein